MPIHRTERLVELARGSDRVRVRARFELPTWVVGMAQIVRPCDCLPLARVVSEEHVQQDGEPAWNVLTSL